MGNQPSSQMGSEFAANCLEEAREIAQEEYEDYLGSLGEDEEADPGMYEDFYNDALDELSVDYEQELIDEVWSYWDGYPDEYIEVCEADALDYFWVGIFSQHGRTFEQTVERMLEKLWGTFTDWAINGMVAMVDTIVPGLGTFLDSPILFFASL